jgi:Reverse transcriptase (RNA-dependent DNA polymerase)
MREPDAKDFRKAMEKEIIDQWDNSNFRLFNRKHVPPDKNILPGVWALRRKRDSHTETGKKHKARWNLDGSKQVHGVDFDNTYSPTVTWPSIRLVLTLTSIHSWKTRQLDFVQAFPQADIYHQQFVVKYTKKQDAEHLRDLLKANYTITEDWKGEIFIGLNLKWDYDNRTIDLSIKGYVQKALQQFKHEKPKRPQHAPSKWTAPQYGAAIQMVKPEDQSPPLDAPGIKFLMKVVGTFLYYARAVDMTIQVALGSTAAAQSKGTEATMDAAIHLLNYAATHPDATL